MKFLNLSIHNFLTIGAVDFLNLDGKGLVLIQGINEDDTSATSNGVGKSSIPDALCWALYGVTARGISGDSVVNRTAKKNAKVSIVMLDGSTTYQIDRYRKHAEFKNQTFVKAWTDTDPSAVVDMTKGTERETQEVIDGIMGCSLDVFMAAIYAGQEAMPDLPKMTDKQLKLLIEESAGVERLETAYSKAREKWSGAKAQLDRLMLDKSSKEATLHTTRVQIEQAKMKHKDFEESRKGRAEGYTGNAATIRDEMLALGVEMKKFDEAALTAEVAQIEKQLAEHGELLKGRVPLQAALNDAVRHQARMVAALETSANGAKRIKAAFENAAEEMKKPCPECGKPHTEDELETYRAHLKGKLDGELVNLKTAKDAKEVADAQVEKCKKALEVFEATVPDVGAVSARRNEIASSVVALTRIKNQIMLKKKDRDANIERAESAMTEANPHAGVIEHLSGQETALMCEIVEVDTKIIAAQDNATLYENCVKVFGPAGVRAHILDTVTPFLNERTADYLSALSDGNITAVWSTLSTTAKGDLKEKFNIEVTNDKGADSFAGLSGGEKRKVRLSTMLALQDLVASRATKPIDLWIGDEIDDALDTAGLERLMGVLERKARERGTVLVVSHNELRDWIDNVVTVTKRGGTSVIEGALCE